MKHRYLWPGFIAGLVASATLGWLIGSAATRLTESAFYAAEIATAFIVMIIFYVVARRFYRRREGAAEAQQKELFAG